jgi:hypothetical protein
MAYPVKTAAAGLLFSALRARASARRDPQHADTTRRHARVPGCFSAERQLFFSEVKAGAPADRNSLFRYGCVILTVPPVDDTVQTIGWTEKCTSSQFF